MGKRITFPPLTKAQVEKRPMTERLFTPLPPIIEGNEKDPESNEDDNKLTDTFDLGSDEHFASVQNIRSNIKRSYPRDCDSISIPNNCQYLDYGTNFDLYFEKGNVHNLIAKVKTRVMKITI